MCCLGIRPSLPVRPRAGASHLSTASGGAVFRPRLSQLARVVAGFVGGVALLHALGVAFHHRVLSSAGVLTDPYYRTIVHLFERHCGWTPPSAFLLSLAASRAYPLPLLVDAAGDHCPSSSLPYTSVDLWFHHADVAIVQGTTAEAAERALDEHCNRGGTDRACVVFVERPLVYSGQVGADFLLKVLRRPFVLLTSDNDDPCLPYSTVAANADTADVLPPSPSAAAVDALIHSPLLIRWYSKNMCIMPTATNGKLLSVPLGPKWQFHSTALDGESKVETKARILAAGARDPRGLFSSGAKRRTVYMAMSLGTTDGPFYEAFTGVRRQLVNHLNATGLLDSPHRGGDNSDDLFVVHVETNGTHGVYMQNLARSAFVLAPPGRGIDTHRVWEALSVGTIPIVLLGPLDWLFEGLPLVIVTNVTEVTQANLRKWYDDLHQASRVAAYQWERATAFYWLRRIVEDAMWGGQQATVEAAAAPATYTGNVQLRPRD